MKIAILGWGSLIWNRGDLAMTGEWQPDGPMLPVEYARVSQDGRLTLVIAPGMPAVPTYWGVAALPNLNQAITNLKQREQTGSEYIGYLRKDEARSRTGTLPATIITTLHDWLHTHHLDAVIWTNLPPRFDKTTGRMPTIAEALDYLRGLDGDTRQRAETYIRRTPPQIRTPIRAAVETHLGWMPVS
jgi:hypothetical protein